MQGNVSWQSPSNIALIKYWGKHGRQLPRNASISFTLSNCISTTEVEYDTGAGTFSVEFNFEGQRNDAFGSRIGKFLLSIVDKLPWIEQSAFKIASKNSFPHSSGIASSASAMSAMAMCLVDIDAQIQEMSYLDIPLASELSRLGSGSASRSVIPQLGVWGECHIEDASDDYAIPYADQVDPVFHTFHDDILIVSASEKSVSSSAGHQLMDQSVFAAARYALANDRLLALTSAMQTGDLDTFGSIVEDEALTLHGLMMCSEPSFALLEPNTLNLINAIRTYRSETNIPVYFTLDAGPNIHLLYPDSFSKQVSKWRDEVLIHFCENQRIITDQVGHGPKKLY